MYHTPMANIADDTAATRPQRAIAKKASRDGTASRASQSTSANARPNSANQILKDSSSFHSPSDDSPS